VIVSTIGPADYERSGAPNEEEAVQPAGDVEAAAAGESSSSEQQVNLFGEEYSSDGHVAGGMEEEYE
jgi:hypothetical protein